VGEWLYMAQHKIKHFNDFSIKLRQKKKSTYFSRKMPWLVILKSNLSHIIWGVLFLLTLWGSKQIKSSYLTCFNRESKQIKSSYLTCFYRESKQSKSSYLTCFYRESKQIKSSYLTCFYRESKQSKSSYLTCFIEKVNKLNPHTSHVL
jgi:hypothetical protein